MSDRFTTVPDNDVVITLTPPVAWSNGNIFNGVRTGLADARVAGTSGATLTYQFIGTSTTITGDTGFISVLNVTVDGDSTRVNAGSEIASGLQLRTLFEADNLDGTVMHTVEVTSVGTGAVLISNISWTFDPKATLPTPTGSNTLQTLLPRAAAGVTLSPPAAWTPGNRWETFINGDATAVGTTTSGATVSYTFFGTDTSVFGDSDKQQFISATVDGTQQNVDVLEDDTPNLKVRPIFSQTGLSLANHTVTLVSTGALFVENIQFIGPVDGATTQPAASPNPTTTVVTTIPGATGNPGDNASLTQPSVRQRTGAIAGGIVGGLSFLVLLFVGMGWYLRRRESKSRNSRSFASVDEEIASWRRSQQMSVEAAMNESGMFGGVTLIPDYSNLGYNNTGTNGFGRYPTAYPAGLSQQALLATGAAAPPALSSESRSPSDIIHDLSSLKPPAPSAMTTSEAQEYARMYGSPQRLSGLQQQQQQQVAPIREQSPPPHPYQAYAPPLPPVPPEPQMLSPNRAEGWRAQSERSLNDQQAEQALPSESPGSPIRTSKLYLVGGPRPSQSDDGDSQVYYLEPSEKEKRATDQGNS